MYATATLSTKLEQEWTDRHADRLFDFDGIGTVTGGALLERIFASGDRDRDRLLYRLLELAHAGDQGAERILVQSLIPIAKHHAHRVRVLDGFSHADRVGIAIAAAWNVVRRYPMRRTAKVRENLGMEILAELTPKPDANERHIHRYTETVSAEDLEDLMDGWTPRPEPEVQLVRIFTWAIDHDVVTRDQVALLTRAYLGEMDMDTLAAELEVKTDTLYKRVARIRTRIADAWAAAGEDLAA